MHYLLHCLNFELLPQLWRSVNLISLLIQKSSNKIRFCLSYSLGGVRCCTTLSKQTIHWKWGGVRISCRNTFCLALGYAFSREKEKKLALVKQGAVGQSCPPCRDVVIVMRSAHGPYAGMLRSVIIVNLE